MTAKSAKWRRAAFIALLSLILVLPVEAQYGHAPAPQEDIVLVELTPQSQSVVVGDVFEVRVVISAGSHPVVGAQAYLDFNPKRLECLEAIPGNTLTDLFIGPKGPIDNVKGQINFAAGKLLGDPPTGTFDLVTLRFRALAATPSTALSFATETPRATTVVGTEGYRYPLSLVESQISASAGPKLVWLPLALRQ